MGVPKRVDKWWIGWQNRLANIDLVSVTYSYMRGVDIVLSQIQQGQGQAREGGRERILTTEHVTTKREGRTLRERPNHRGKLGACFIHDDHLLRWHCNKKGK